MKTSTSWSTAIGGAQAVADAYANLEAKLGGRPTYLYCTFSGYDATVVADELGRVAAGLPVHGGTSCQGVMTEAGFHGSDGLGLALFGLVDAEGSYGVGAAEIGVDPRAAAVAATQAALHHAERSGEAPAIVLLSAAPGCEELLIEGIESLIGNKVPILGGSSADNTIAGHWRQIANGRAFANAVVITVLFPSVETMYAFHSGYEPTAHRGRVTRAEGRVLSMIDGKPAADVYNVWTSGALRGVLGSANNILALTTMAPLGRMVGTVGGVPYYRLSHPDRIRPDGSLTLFSTVHEGDELVLMHGTPTALVNRAGRVAAAAMKAYGASTEQVSGGFVVYCAGCMLAVRAHVGSVVLGISSTLPGVPFVGTFTFGEQGCFVGGENRHGNLMISVLLFGR